MNTPRIKSALLSLGIFGVSLALCHAQTTLTNGLVAYWPLDTTDGVTTPDLALGNNLSLFNSLFTGSPPSNVPGEHGNCFAFSNTNYLALSYSTSFPDLPVYNTTAYTVAFWVKGVSAQVANKVIFSENAFNNSGLLFEFNTSAGKIRVDLRDNANIVKINNVSSTNATVFTDGTVWHHIGWVDVHGVCQLYIDGNKDTNLTYTPSVAPQTATITSVGALIRSSGVALGFTGSVDEIMEWNRALSQAEIQNAMNNGIPGPILPTAPTFLTSPSSTTNAMGDRVVLSANVFGNETLGFQWSSNNVPLLGQTNNSLLLTGLTTPGTNFYTLTATNAAGTNTSAPAMVVVLPDLPATNIDSGLVGYWPFNNLSNSATSTPDLVDQNDMQLTAMTSANLVPGEFGNALSFDGATQYGSEVSGAPVYDLSTTYTVAFWVNGAANQADKQVFANGNSVNGNYFFIGTDNTGTSGKVDVRINPAGLADTVSSNTAFDGTWHQIVWVDQNGNGLLYIDGVLDSAIYSYAHGALGALALNNTSVGALLADPLRDFYAGDIDEVATWNRRLSYTEIQSIFATGIPVPPLTIKPSVTPPTTQPADLTSGVYQGDTVSLSASATGTAPLSYQWYVGAAKVSGASNPSALTNTLTLTNVQPANSGSYTLVVTNAAGAVTSSVVVLNVMPYTPAATGAVLQVDFNYSLGPIVQPGFSSMTLNQNPATFNGPSITLTPIGATTLSDRARTTPTNNPPTLTQADIYSQFIFSAATTPSTGIDMLIQRLAPNTTYALTIWSWDSENSGVSDWTEVASGTPQVIENQYSFTGSSTPIDYSDVISGLVKSSSSGQLDIQGVNDPNFTKVSVFLNALTLVANPAVTITNAHMAADGNLQLTAVAEYVGQTVIVQESSDLTAGWQFAGDAIVISTSGPFTVLEFPLTNTQEFYRAVYQAP